MSLLDDAIGSELGTIAQIKSASMTLFVQTVVFMKKTRCDDRVGILSLTT